MPIYMDRHDIKDTNATEVAEAHKKDLAIQDKYGCKALTYWFDEENGTTFCLIEAPRKQALEQMHQEAHGDVPNNIIEVNPEAVKAFLGRIEDPPAAAETPLNDSAFRTILFTDMPLSVLFQFKSLLIHIIIWIQSPLFAFALASLLVSP